MDVGETSGVAWDLAKADLGIPGDKQDTVYLFSLNVREMVQGGPLPVISGVISPINGLINR